MSYYKDFKFTLKIEGKPLVETEVRLGSKEHPWPKNWKENGMALKAIMDYEDKLIAEHIEITREEL